MKFARSPVKPKPAKMKEDPAWLGMVVQILMWTLAAVGTAYFSGQGLGVAVGVLGLICIVALMSIERYREWYRWVRPIHLFSDQFIAIAKNPNCEFADPGHPELSRLVTAVREMQKTLLANRVAGSMHVDPETPFATSGEIEAIDPLNLMLTHSGAFDPSSSGHQANAASLASEPDEMISRLDLKTLRWIDSSPAEQAFLGWNLPQLRAMSFFEVIDSEDRELARTQVAAAITKGEGHNLLYRIRTARQELKAVELHLAVRYGRNQTTGHSYPIHLKVRSTDMTKKVRADQELRRRTKELINVNSQLRQSYRELEISKNRYSDLYHNAPALYLSVDAEGTIFDCNDTLLHTLGRERDEVINQPYTNLLVEDLRSTFDSWFDALQKEGHVELESRWLKSNGEAIDVWLSSTAVLAADNTFRYSRSVGRDVTMRRALEAELQDKHERLARVNAELLRKNKELDEFAYIVAHDLREPLRTLISFSDFLEKDCGERIGDAGKETLNHIVEAARRMRSLITDLETLGRAGKVAGDFGRVKLEEIIARVRADFREMLRCNGAQIHVVGEVPDLWGDSTRIGQLMANLVGNGLKYNRNSCPKVEIEAIFRTKKGFVTLAVRDNGIGIDPKFHTKIFELFRRLHTREEYEGTGAGLSICQKIVEAHGGRIRVESLPGQGATFLMTLPMASANTIPLDQPSHVV